MKQGLKEEDGEEKKEDDDDEGKRKGKWTDEEVIQDSLGVEEGMLVKFHLWSVLLLLLLAKKKQLNNHIVDIHKDPAW